MTPVVVGLSGGVDSFVTAMLLKRQGYDVHGVHLKLWGTGDDAGLYDLCRSLGITWQCADGRALFKERVVDPFICAYLSGRTPSPCTICNRDIKWSLLCREADRLGVRYIATGHYIRTLFFEGYWYVRKGVDPNKDQSYFLAGLGQDVLSRVLTPLGEYTKAEVKALAESNGYAVVARRRESMGICFLAGTDYRDFIIRHSDGTQVQQSGDVLDIYGNVIGRHNALLHYTIGQKRGLPSVGGQPLYVKEIRVKDNTIIAAAKSQLHQNILRVEEVHAVRREELFAGDVEVKIRGIGLNPEGYIHAEEQEDGGLLVHLGSTAWAVAPGQPIAFYRGDLLIGGGVLGDYRM